MLMRWLRRFVASAPTKNVAKTLEILTFTKKVMLWLQFGGPPINAAAATATYLKAAASAADPVVYLCPPALSVIQKCRCFQLSRFNSSTHINVFHGMYRVIDEFKFGQSCRDMCSNLICSQAWSSHLNSTGRSIVTTGHIRRCIVLS